MATTAPLKDPNLLFYQSVSIRRCILYSYWAVVFLAVPIWWRLTSITRLALPESRVAAQQHKNLNIPLTLRVDSDDDTISKLRTFLQQRVMSEPGRWSGCEFSVQNGPIAENGPNEYSVYTKGNSDEIGYRHLSYSLKHHSVENLADTLALLIAPPSVSPNRQNRAAVYAPRYRLAFSLFNEDASKGNYIHDWDITSAVHDHIQPLLNKLSPLHNFTIESQVQFVAPLAFEPRKTHDGQYALTQEHLTVFVNSAHWTLSSSVSNDPVLHFVVFLPSAQRRPLTLLDAEDNISTSNAFLLPQWGGIIVYNPLDTSLSSHRLTSLELQQIFSLFAHQLQVLLGLNDLPKNIPVHPNSSGILGWQLDELLRRRTLENTREAQATLKSIVQLVHQIENMPVESDVLNDIQDALSSLEKLFATSTMSLTDALQSSANSLYLSSRAFFNPGMLAMLYFPAEHKYAVYTPLFASAIIPLAAAALREIAAWRRARRASQQ